MRPWLLAGRASFVAAPLVDASDAAFRLLAREHGVALAHTPMLNARLIADEPPYVQRHLDPAGDKDRPLAAQLCGHDERHLLAAVKVCEEASVDAIDFNLGCPQEIARRGRYGAFLLEEEPSRALRCVQALVSSTELPVTAKIRLQATRELTLDVALRLQDAGAAALTVHARTRKQLHRAGGVRGADWDLLRDVVSALDIPVVANGGVRTRECADACLQYTGAAAVMSGEALLENPALFASNRRRTADGSIAYVDQDSIAARYLELCGSDAPPRKGIRYVKEHMRRMLYSGLLEWPDLNDELYVATDLPSVARVIARLANRGWAQPAFHTDQERPGISWYARHRAPAAESDGSSHSCNGGSSQSRSRTSAVAAGAALPDNHAEWRRRYLTRSAAKRHSAARKRLKMVRHKG